jgi:hypothetical protein
VAAYAMKEVFIDTNIFIEGNFDIVGKVFSRLQKLSSVHIVNLHLTTITQREIHNNIRKAFREARGAFDSFKSKGKVLRNVDEFDIVFKAVNIEEPAPALIEKIDKFIKDYFHIVDVNMASVADVFDKYFEAAPPFAEKGAKKSEFPDAFVVSALEKWCQDNTASMYIVSIDKDLRKAREGSERLIYLEKADELFDLFAADEESRHEILETINEHQENILEMLQEAFEQAEFFVSDEYGDVLEVSVNDIGICDDAVLITEVELRTKPLKYR